MFKPVQSVATEEGLDFTPDTKVTFYLKGDLETGTIVKQMQNSAIVKLNKTSDNKDIVFQSLGNVVISYKDMRIKHSD